MDLVGIFTEDTPRQRISIEILVPVEALGQRNIMISLSLSRQWIGVEIYRERAERRFSSSPVDEIQEIFLHGPNAPVYSSSFT